MTPTGVTLSARFNLIRSGDVAYKDDKAAWAWFAAALVLIGGGIGWYLYQAREPATSPVAVTGQSAPATTAAEPQIEYPVPSAEPADAAAAEPATAAEADTFDGALGQLLGAPLDGLLYPDRLIYRIVVTVNSLAGEAPPLRLRAATPVAGKLAVEPAGDKFTLSAANYARYDAQVALLQAIDAQQLVNLYFRHYPQFQKAYDELGYRGRYFNDRLVQVIDQLLTAADVQAPVELQLSQGVYRYADPALEELSSGRKALLRMGPENATATKAKLREIRNAIVSRARKP